MENIVQALAVNGGEKTKTKPFPKWPIYSDRELELVTDVIKSQEWWRMTGTKVKEFESKFAAYHDAKYCLAVTNGTHAIELFLAALDIGPGDEVIVPGFTFISTMSAVLYAGAVPVMADVDPQTFCILPEAIEQAITPRTKAIIPVHMAGHICDMDKICAIAEKHGLHIIEDAAHAHGGEWNNRKIGTFGVGAIFSFQNGKICASGEGGAMLTNDPEIYKKAFLIHGVGRPENDRLYEHLEMGSNYRMSELQAAVLIAQLERLEELNTIRSKNARLLDELLSGVKGIEPQRYDPRVTLNTHYMYMFYYDATQFGGLSRQDFVDALIAEGIPAFIAYPAVCDVEFYQSQRFRRRINLEHLPQNPELPCSRKVAREAIWLPHFTLLGDAGDTGEIADAIRKIQSGMKA